MQHEMSTTTAVVKMRVLCIVERLELSDTMHGKTNGDRSSDWFDIISVSTVSEAQLSACP